MRADNPQWAADARIDSNANNTQQIVPDGNISFKIPIEYHDHPVSIHANGYFTAVLNKQTASGWQQVGTPQSRPLGGGGSGDWYDTLEIDVTMTDPAENYQLVLHCEAQFPWPWSVIWNQSVDLTVYFQAIHLGAIGNFTLDFIPIAIVYCPPSQDMTNALTQSKTFGTQLTLGESSGFESDTSVSFKIDFLGIIGEGVGFQSSQSVSNQSTSGIQYSHFRNTTVTADNQRAIGRAYWGPLNDIFVILVNPAFAVSQRADGSLFYSGTKTGGEQMILVPARKLLRPSDDPIANSIPADSRRKLLELDPFITNLDLFFPDSGADLAMGADSGADPTFNNRAELLGRWWLDGGTEVSYSVGQRVDLLQKETNEVKYGSRVSINATVGANYDGIKASLGLDQNNNTWVGFQSSKENDAGWTTSAGCFLIRNQNERDLDGIELYFDKLFSTFMFRRLHSRKEPPILEVGVVSGKIYGVDNVPLRSINVQLVDDAGREYWTATRIGGLYSFYNLPTGKYTLIVGDQQKPVAVTSESTPMNPVLLDVKKVRRPIDLHKSPIWELTQVLGIASDVLRKTISRLPKSADFEHLGKALGVDAETQKEWARTLLIQPQVSPRKHSKKHTDKDDNHERRERREEKPKKP